jgi:DNA (cytosine-5)-methyltransferase 1
LSRPSAPTEHFVHQDGAIERRILLNGELVGRSRRVATEVPPDDQASMAAAFDQAWLRSGTAPAWARSARPVRTVDLFSGCGALSLGAAEACRALGRRLEPVLAVDIEPWAVASYAANLPGGQAVQDSVLSFLDPAGPRAGVLASMAGQVDLLIGGPPCQGHSDLNNHTRRDDPKNQLYNAMARFAEILEPRWILIENVPGAQHDRSGVVQRTWQELEDQGYRLSGGVLQGVAIGVPQRRRRYFMLASRDRRPPAVADIQAALERPARPLSWAIGDLLDATQQTGTYDRPSTHHPRNKRRIGYLFEHDLHDLPDAQRPACHRDKPHSYKSVYGRMHWDKPAQTITTGFGSCGQGRFVHSLQQRTLTPHEAARVQFIPDFFRFGDLRRGALQAMIGNAVPPRMAYALCLALMAGS